MKQDQVLITQFNTKSSREKKSRLGTSSASRPEHSTINQIVFSEHENALASTDPVGVMSPYKKVLQCILPYPYPQNSTRRLQRPRRALFVGQTVFQFRQVGHWYKVQSRVQRFERTIENKKKLEHDEELRRSQYEDQWSQRILRSGEIKERTNKSRVENVKGAVKHHAELIEKRQREREYENYQSEQLKKRKKPIDTESERSWHNDGKKISEPDNLQGINSARPNSPSRKPLPTYNDACEKKLQLWRDEQHRGILQSRELERRTEKAVDAHQRVLQQRKERFAQLDQRIKSKNDKSREQQDESRDTRVQKFMRKFDNYQMRKGAQEKDISDYFKNRSVKEDEKFKSVQENLTKKQTEEQEWQMRLSSKMVLNNYSEYQFQPRIRSVSMGSKQMFSRTNSDHHIKQQIIQQKHMKNQKNNHILMRHMRQTESNQFYRNMMNRIQESGNYYNFKFDMHLKE